MGPQLAQSSQVWATIGALTFSHRPLRFICTAAQWKSDVLEKRTPMLSHRCLHICRDYLRLKGECFLYLIIQELNFAVPVYIATYRASHLSAETSCRHYYQASIVG